jgi:hypothetical protein
VLEAQTDTAEGVAAFVREDYERASEILKPLAERWPDPGDPVAQFFMAMMYESGHGVSADAVRACVLYAQADIRDALFQTQAHRLGQRLRLSLSAEQLEECVFLQGIGFDHGFEPATFPLESLDSIAIELRSATISHHGKQRRVDGFVRTSPGVVFLPIQHTRLLAGPTRSTPRHFVEVMSWLPSQRHSWVLNWSLSEIVRDELISVAEGELTTASGPRPPVDSSVDLRDLVRLGVNDLGIPEWRILKGPDARSQGIPSESEREEIAGLERARRLADADVDWNRMMDRSRPPSLTYSDSNGCGNVQLFGWSLDRGEAISVTVNEDLASISPGDAVTLSLPHSAVHLEVQVYDQPRRTLPFCRDMSVHDGARVETWSAIAGTVTIELSPRGVRTLQPNAYRARIRIDGLELMSTAGVRVKSTASLTLAGIAGMFY